MTDDIAALRDAIAALNARVELLETRADSATTSVREATAARTDALWALHEVDARRDQHPDTSDGTIMLVGSLTLPTGEPVAWQQSAGTSGLLDVEWDDRVAALSALAHPVRLDLVRGILLGRRSTAELAETQGLGTTGQLHHHLRQLVAAGWVAQTSRGHYAVPAARVVPLLALVMGAAR